MKGFAESMPRAGPGAAGHHRLGLRQNRLVPRSCADGGPEGLRVPGRRAERRPVFDRVKSAEPIARAAYRVEDGMAAILAGELVAIATEGRRLGAPRHSDRRADPRKDCGATDPGRCRSADGPGPRRGAGYARVGIQRRRRSGSRAHAASARALSNTSFSTVSRCRLALICRLAAVRAPRCDRAAPRSRVSDRRGSSTVCPPRARHRLRSVA